MRKPGSFRRPSRWKTIGPALAAGGFVGALVKGLDLFSLVSYWGDRSLWTVLIALVGALMWMTRLRWLVGTGASFLAVLWLAVAFSPLCAWLARDLPRKDPLGPADAVFVLGSSIQDDGELSAEATSRLLHALELIGQGYAPRLIVPELPPPVPSYAAPAATITRNLGMSLEILPVGPTYNTHDEAVAVGSLFRKRDWHRLLLVTSPHHSRRAALTFEKQGIEVFSSPSVQTQFDFETLKDPDHRLRAFPYLMHERLGLWVYEWRGWID